MSKKRLQLKGLYDRRHEISEQIREIAEVCEREKRLRDEKENDLYNALMREAQQIEMQMTVLADQYGRENPNAVQDAETIIRENARNGKQTKIALMREIVMVDTAETAGLVPVKIADILKPLSEGLILDKVGLPFYTGLAGDYIWPTYEAVEATVQNKAAALTDTVITMDKLTASPERIGIAIPVSRESIFQTEGILEMIVKDLMPHAVTRLLNRIMFGTELVNNATLLKGPFVDLIGSAKSISAEPTFKELVQMKAEVLATGIDGENMCWVMTKAQKALLEATPKDKGSGIMVCENDHIAGLPVFTTQYIGEKNIGLGDWRYQPTGLFGDISFVIDPFTQARKDAVDFVLNAHYATTTLRPEAFKIVKVGAA